MKCLFIFNNAPLFENYHGAATRYTQAFKALVHMGVQVHVLRLLETKRKPDIIEFEQSQSPDLKAHYNQAITWQDLVYSSPIKRSSSRLSAIVKGMLHPLQFSFPEITALQKLLPEVTASIQPDFLLVEMYPAAALVALIQPDIPWILGHHDWIYRYRQFKALGRVDLMLRAFFIKDIQRRAERLVAQRCNAVISASYTEAAELKNLGVRRVFVIPSTYDSVPPPSIESVPHRPMRIIHLGQLVTYSNACGLRDYLREVVPRLPLEWELYIIGSTHNGDPELLGELKSSNARILGHVDNLSTVLRPFDIAVIPFKYNLGERTKIPLLFNYAQVVVAHEASVAGNTLLRPGENCFVESSLDRFPTLLQHLAEQPNLRKRVGLEARATFERFYTLEAQIPTFRSVLAEIGHASVKTQ